MKIFPEGDYYIWFCDWCDSSNLTLWTRFEISEPCCGVCHHPLTFEAAEAV